MRALCLVRAFGARASGALLVLLLSLAARAEGVGPLQVYLQDTRTGARTLLSRAASGGPGSGPCSQPCISEDGTRIAFTSLAPDLSPDDPDQTADVVLVDPAAGRRTVATASVEGPCDQPALDADGSVLAFSGRVDGRREVFVREEGEPRQVTRHGGFEPSLSDDGRTVTWGYEVRSAGPILVRSVLHDLQAGRNLPIGGDEAFGARLSGDGAWVVFGNGQVRLLDVERNRARPLGPTEGWSGPGLQHFVGGASISRNGARVAFGHMPERTAGERVLLYDRRGGSVRTLGPGHSPALSADGRSVAFVQDGTLVMVDLLSGAQRTLARGVEGRPDLSRDGRCVVYAAR